MSKGDGMDVDHIKPLSKGGKTEPDNLRVESKHKNESYPRNPDGSMKQAMPAHKQRKRG